MPVVKKLLGAANGSELLQQLSESGKIVLTKGDGSNVELTADHVEVGIQAKEGWAAAQGKGCVVVLSTQITDELRREGYARDLVRFIQDQRKKMQLQYTDRISVGVVIGNSDVAEAIEENREYMTRETLADQLGTAEIAGTDRVEIKVADTDGALFVVKS